MDAVLHVFFATGRIKHNSWWHRQVSRIIRVLTLSPICHCMIGFEGAVLNPNLAGVLYWPHDTAIRHFPSLYAVFRVPVQHNPGLKSFEKFVGVAQPAIPRLIRWLRFGRGPWVYDCLCIALACLKNAGVPVDPHISTPAGLYRWLKQKGYAHVSHAGKTDAEFRHNAEEYGTTD